jgi:hemolysin activation/secretion protein
VDAGTSVTAAGPLAFSGQGSVAGGRYNQLLRRFGEYEHKVVYSLDYRLYDNVCSLVSFGGSCGGGASATVAVHPVGLSYAGQWAPPRRQLTFQVGVYQNIPGGSYGSEADFTQVNPAAKADYHLSREELNFVQALWRDFQARLVLYSQYTDDTLIPGEQFGLGGMNSVRGFLERAISNDKGYSGQAELYTPDFSPALKLGRSTLRALAFYDFGAAFANNPQPGQISATHISSAGAGLRYGYGNYVSLRADAAWVIHGDGLEPDGHFRADFALMVSF